MRTPPFFTKVSHSQNINYCDHA